MHDHSGHSRIDREASLAIRMLEAIRDTNDAFGAGHEIEPFARELLRSLLRLTHSEHGLVEAVQVGEDGEVRWLPLARSDTPWSDAARDAFLRFVIRQRGRHLGTPGSGPFPLAEAPANADIEASATGRDERSELLGDVVSLGLRFGSELVGVASLANPTADYPEDLAEVLAPLLGTGAGILYAARERHRREERLRALEDRERRFRTIADLSHDWEFWQAPDGHFVYVSPSCERITGYRAEEFLQDPGLMSALAHPDDEPGLVTHVHAESPEEPERHDLEFRIRTKDGKDRWIGHSCQRVVAEDGTYLGRRATNRDITGPKRVEQALRQSEQKYHSLFQQSVEGIFLHDFDGRILDVNRAACAQLGYSREELLTRTVFDLHPKDPDAPNLPREEIIRLWSSWAPDDRAKIESQHQRKDGEAFPVEITTGVIRFGDRRLLLAIVQDITDRRRAEEAVRRNEARLQSLVDIQQRRTDSETTLLDFALAEAIKLTGSAVGYLYLYDEDTEEFRLNSWSREAMEACRIAEPQTVYSLSTTGIWGDAVRFRKPLILNDFRAAHPRKKGFPEGHAPLSSFMTIPVLHDDRIVAVVGVANKESPYQDTDRLQLTLLMDSIWMMVERRRAEAETAALQGQLQQAMKMEAVGRLAGGVAHDFNNLLLAILGNVELARMDLPSWDPLSEVLDEINQAAVRATQLTRQLLAFSRKQLIEPKVIDLNELIEAMHRILSRLIGEDVTLEIVPEAGLGAVEVDPGQFEQILVNLAVNARDAMPEGGRLVIETSNITLDADYCRRHADARPGAHVMLAVSDTGHGMSEGVRRHLFEPFFTTKPKGMGTGLGLATIYGAVKQAKGSINVYSEPGQGTTFKIYLPRVERPTQRLELRRRVSTLPTGAETILVVEDERVVCEMAVRILERLGYRVLCAASGEQALEVAQSQPERIHLLLTDVVLPGMNGRQLAERFIEIHPSAQVLYTSGYTENTIAHHGVLDEGLQFIGKPYTPEGLARKLRELLDH